MYCDPSIPIFLLTFAAGVLLTLVTFSVPFIKSFYFLHSSVAGGITYGIWGWCLDVNGSCSPKRLGYREDPEIIPILLKLHVLFPIAAGLTILSSVTLIPVMFSSYRGLYPFPLFTILASLACICSLVGIGVCFATWLTALQRLRSDGFQASLGPLIWMALASAVVLLFVSMNAGCYMVWRRGRRRSFIYTY